MKKIKLHFCDNSHFFALQKKNKVNLVVTSPPYDNLRTYIKGEKKWTFASFKEVADGLYSVMATNSVVVWVVSDSTVNKSKTCNSFRQVLYFKKIGFKLHDTMIFNKTNPVPFEHHKRQTPAFEFMFVLVKGDLPAFNPRKEQSKTYGVCTKRARFTKKDKQYNTDAIKVQQYKFKTNVWSYTVGTAKIDHPAVFPLQLAIDNILTWSNKGDIVLDPFMGSGTVGIAALQTGRCFIGVERVREFFNLSEKRINSELNQGSFVDPSSYME